jgi:metallo-beta-lactamase class B
MPDMLCRILSAALLVTALAQAQGDPTWDEPFPPHRIADNLYYVGTRGLSSYLITTPQGHILINSSFERSVPLIRAAVEKLGFKFTDVKILLESHAHGDHMQGNFLVKELTGAKIWVMKQDVDFVESGGAGQYVYFGRGPSRQKKGGGWKAVKVDHVIKDGEKIRFGNATITALLTPGHTLGCTTYVMDVTDNGKKYNVVIIGSPNVNPGYKLVNNSDYPGMSQDFARTFKVLKSLKPDIYLGAHGNYYRMEDKYAKLKPGAANPFVDPEGYKAYVAEKEQAYLTELAKQKAAAN